MVEQNLDSLFAALADPTRRAIVARLAEGPKTVGELAEPFETSFAAVSKHVQVLDSAGLVSKQRDGRRILCTLQPDRLRPLATWVHDYERFWNERLDELEGVIRDIKRRKS